MKAEFKQMSPIDMPDARLIVEGLPSPQGGGPVGECQGIRDDLNQAQGLLHDAIGKLTDSFQSFESDSRQQLQLIEKMITEMSGADKRGDANIDTIFRINQQISTHVDRAVTVLQFEDLTQQLIGKVMIRVDRLEKTFSGFERQNSGEAMPLPKASRIPCIVQEDMGAGSIELF